MRRRDCLALAAALAALRPIPVLVQERNSPVLGFLNSASPEAIQPYLAAFHEGLSEFGFHEGQNLRIEWRWARGAYERLPALAAELVEMKVQVLVSTGGEVPALAARRATTTIPIVFGVGGDALEEGLVTNLGRPGTNLTGITHLTSKLEAKRMELLWEALPPDSPLGVLINPAQKVARRQRQEVEEVGRSVGRGVFIVEASVQEEFESAFERLVQAGAAGVVVGSDPFFHSRRDRLIALAARHRLPAIYQWRDFPAVGGLMSYGTNLADGYRQAGIYAGRILKGERPADLPVVQSTRFELVVNLKTAKALGIELPPSLLARADEVIE